MSLAGVRQGQRCRVTAVRPGSLLSHRLMEIGLFSGAEVEVLPCAPLGDPLRIRVGDTEFALRSQDAELVEVVPS
jgi:ferrous iron transport protein A